MITSLPPAQCREPAEFPGPKVTSDRGLWMEDALAFTERGAAGKME